LVDDVKHQGFRDRTSQNLIRHSAVDNLYKQLCAFSTQENKYKYDPFVRAKHFEKSTGIRLNLFLLFLFILLNFSDLII